MSFPHPDLHHPRAHRRTFARFAMWFADWQGTPMFIAILTGCIVCELLWNQVLAPLVGAHGLAFDPNTWLLNLGLSLLASYAASLSVMGSKVQSEQLTRLLRENTELTRQVHELSEQIHRVVSER